jgi:membrane protein DedA with SNARE-associated domain
MEILSSLHALLAGLMAHIGYSTVFVLMAMEASVFPVPSEAVMIPAGYLAAEGTLDPVLAFFSGLAGVGLGSAVNYAVGRYLGRAFVLRYGPYLLISRESYEKSERLFARNAVLFTFVGRFIPVVRHVISIPAGMARMPFGVFMAVTLAGSGIWLAILMACGYFFGRNQEIIADYLHRFSLGLVGLVGFVVVFWVVKKFFFSKGNK